MSKIDDSIADLNQFRLLNSEIASLVKYTIPSAAIMSAVNTSLSSAVLNSQKTLRASLTLACDPFIKSITESTNVAGAKLSNYVTDSISSAIKLQTESYKSVLEATYKNILENAKFFQKEYAANLTLQWNSVVSGIATDSFGKKDQIYDEIFLDDDVADKVSEIIEQSVPDTNEEKSGLLSKIKGKISIGDLIGIISILVGILTFIYGQLSSNAEQKVIEQQNQTIIEEFHKTQKMIEEEEQRKEMICSAIQQLTDTAQELESESPPVHLDNEHEEQNLNQPDRDSKPKN